MQIRYGLRRILEKPMVYTAFQNIIGARKYRDAIVNDYMEICPGLKVLDVGCGPGDLLNSISCEIDYFGFDYESSYIEKAKKVFFKRGRFTHMDVTNFDFHDARFDRIIMIGVLHHLEDFEIRKLFSVLSRLLTKDGFLLCVENTYVPEQSFFARKLISMDRGKNVRSPLGYSSLCNEFFSQVSFDISHSLLRIPYTHVLLKCRNSLI